MLEALKNHWREYLMEAWGLGTLMFSAGAFGVIVFHSASPLISLDFTLRNALMDAAMGATAVGIFLSPRGTRSGAHINPAVTLTFWRLGKIESADAFFYVLAQFAGAISGVLISWLIFGRPACRRRGQ